MLGQLSEQGWTWAVVLLGADRVDASLRNAWVQADFLDRLSQLGPVYLWSRDVEPGVLQELSRCSDAAALDVDLVIWVDVCQIFFDPTVLEAGLAQVDFSRVDLFTQWAHARIPLGVGARVTHRRMLESSLSEDPELWLKGLCSMPGETRIHYDEQSLVDFETSRQDTRWSPAMAAALHGHLPGSWDLAGWLAWCSELELSTQESLRFQPDEAAARVDERGVPAPYGFESSSCGHFPTYVMFDITNLCNARCIHCPQSIVGPDGEKPEYLAQIDHLPMEHYRAVIDECAEYGVDFVRITADGEPAVHKGLIEMVAYATAQGVGPVALTTNGSLINAQRAQALLDAGLGMVDFSLDAHRPDTFHRIRVGLSFERTRDNVLRFLELRDRAGSDCRVMVSFVKQDLNVEEARDFRTYWEPLVDEVLVREMTSNVGLNTPTARQVPGQSVRWPCPHFFRRIVINHLGTVKACPIDWRQETTHRSVSEESLYTQWHGDFYWHHRMQHLNQAIPTSSPCSPCTDWSSTPWSLGYEKVVARLKLRSEGES
jgi:sulfatase maturation enzyme AslB (radical SAM superfamily)